LKHFLILFSLILFTIAANCQQSQKDAFILTGKIEGKDTGTVALYYSGNKDIAALKKGKFKFTGWVKGVSDAHLWTDTSNHNFSDHSVVRFLLQPGNLFIKYKNEVAIIRGSSVEDEKRKFDLSKSEWVIPKNKLLKTIDSLYNSCNYHPDNITREKISRLAGELDKINQHIMPVDMKYIRTHPESFLSAFLLSSYKRRLSIDTLQVYYSLLNSVAKNSSEGRKILEYIYPLTNDVSFRNENILMGDKMNDSLVNAQSFYDLSSRDTSSNIVDFKIFKGKYLLIDFWASWCGPCIKNLPHFESLKKMYSSDRIYFISISLDSRSKDWEKAIREHKLSGYQFSDLRAFNGLIPVYCKVVVGIPQYVLINTEGKIINYNAPFPDDPKLKLLLNNLLKEKR
jgi:thiol-disulfide isomerase/thioredoxin